MNLESLLASQPTTIPQETLEYILTVDLLTLTSSQLLLIASRTRNSLIPSKLDLIINLLQDNYSCDNPSILNLLKVVNNTILLDPSLAVHLPPTSIQSLIPSSSLEYQVLLFRLLYLSCTVSPQITIDLLKYYTEATSAEVLKCLYHTEIVKEWEPILTTNIKQSTHTFPSISCLIKYDKPIDDTELTICLIDLLDGLKGSDDITLLLSVLLIQARIHGSEVKSRIKQPFEKVKLVELLQSVDTTTSILAGDVLYEAFEKNKSALVGCLGYGVLAGWLYNKGIVYTPQKEDFESSQHADGKEMTQEEKEAEAERLGVLLERLEKGGMIKPVFK